jgi:hypothetical protein
MSDKAAIGGLYNVKWDLWVERRHGVDPRMPCNCGDFLRDDALFDLHHVDGPWVLLSLNDNETNPYVEHRSADTFFVAGHVVIISMWWMVPIANR